MKYFNKTWLGAVAIVALASCTDDGRLDFNVDKKPESIVELEYLKDYDVLKSYVDRTTNPNFKLGAGVSVADFNKQAVDYCLLATNFDEMTAGWEMKHGGVVQSDGSLKLSDVKAFVETAGKAGMTVFGHTLCWHSNQNAVYLNKLIAPLKISGGPELFPSVITNSDFETNDDGWGGWGNGSTRGRSASGEGYNGTGYAYTFTNPSVAAYYTAQVAHDFATPLDNGSTYRLHFWVKASVAGAIRAEIQSTTDYSSNGFGSIDISTAWKEYTLETTLSAADRNRFVISFGDFAGTVYIDKVTLSKVNPNYSGPSYDPSVITASNFENGSTGWMGWGNGSTRGLSASGEGYGNTGFAYTFTNPSVAASYQAQTAYDFPALENGSLYKLNFKVKASAAGTISADIQTTTDYSSNTFGSFDISTAWKEYTLEVTPSTATRTRFVISFGNFAGTVYIDDITLCRLNPSGSGDQIIEKTPEEKTTIITAELERWIAGMLELTKDKVKAWDVVNEPMSDWPDPSQLKTGVGKSNLPADEFYWQDYLGKDYAVKAIEFARKYGNSNDILFINDYGLEGADQKKCLGLIEYIKYVDSQGVKVDGIGTQMHVTCGKTTYEEISDENKNDGITKMTGIRAMLTNLAATGKLIKISELDMGYRVKGESENLKTEKLTNDQLKEMAEFYKQIVAAYFELIPAAQRYGITVWSPLDSPSGSSWRGGEPIGLWDRNYNRKHAYGSFADALSGK